MPTNSANNKQTILNEDDSDDVRWQHWKPNVCLRVVGLNVASEEMAIKATNLS